MQGQTHLLEQPEVLICSVIRCINQLVEQSPCPLSPSSVFDIKTAPTISISDYLARMVKYMNASVSVYVYALVLLDRAQEFNLKFTIHKRNIHRLLLASTLVAVKYLDDMFYKNSFYASVGGVTLKVLNELELQFLHLINFNCQVDPHTLHAYLQRLQFFNQINHQHPQNENSLLPNPKNSLKTETPRRQKLQEGEEQKPGISLKCEGECK